MFNKIELVTLYMLLYVLRCVDARRRCIGDEVVMPKL
jgi:hypothetical protein